MSSGRAPYFVFMFRIRGPYCLIEEHDFTCQRHFSFQSYSLGFSLVPDAIVGPQAPQGFIYIGDQDLTKIHKIEHQQVPTNDLFVC